MKPQTIDAYHAMQDDPDRRIMDTLRGLIADALPEGESRIWHAHPVTFLADNPIVGYSKLKSCVRLFFWSGQSFETPGLTKSGTFKAAELRLSSVDDINPDRVKAWLAESARIQWDYKNIYKTKGRLEPLCGVQAP